jgi:hypothetical protein
MKRTIQLAVPAALIGFGLLFNTTASFGKKEYTAKEKKGCVFCHTSATSKELNDAGKYYKEKKTLEGFKK